MTGRKLCTLRDCPDHKGHPDWLHVPARRDTPPPTVWLRGRRAA